MSEQSRLAARIDGVALDEPLARELWKEFSAHMDAHEGDMKGFAKLKGWHTVAPEYQQGKAVLLVTTTPEAVVAVSPQTAKPKAAKPAPAAAAKQRRAPPQRPRRKAGAKPKR